MSAIALLRKMGCSAQQALKFNCLRQNLHVLSCSAITGSCSNNNNNDGKDIIKAMTTAGTTTKLTATTARTITTSRCAARFGCGVNDGWLVGGTNAAFGHTHLLTHAGLILPWHIHSNVMARSLTKSTMTQLANKTEAKTSSPDLFGETANLGLFAKFKHMYKKYWYVLIPVHLTTSIGWFGAFYYLSKCGIDVPGMLQYLHLSETIIEKVQNSEMGHYAVAYLCYKVATPLRYALTLGGTTISIKYLVQAGHIKPLPSKRELMKMYEDKKAVRETAKNDNSTLSAKEPTSKPPQDKPEATSSNSKTRSATQDYPLAQCKKSSSSSSK